MLSSTFRRSPGPTRRGRSDTSSFFTAALAPVLLLGGLLAGCGGAEPEPERPRNVLLFVVDTLRADRLGCYGYERPTTPAIDTFARGGMLFQENHSQACWTVPSMISMMSGLYVSTEEQVLPESPVLAELLQARGRTTAAFVGNRTLTNNRGFQRGFDHFVGPRPGGMSGMAHSVVQEFTGWYEANAPELGAGEGWFAWLHPLDPHDPYEPSEQYRKFTGQELPNEADLRERWREAEPLVEKYGRGRPSWGFEEAALDMRSMSNLYDGEVVQVDHAFQQLLDFLEKTGERERTLIIFASDHGEKLWEHMRYPRGIRSRLQGGKGAPEGVKDFFAYGHRAWFHEELWNTPLIVVGPGMPKGVRSHALSANLDIYPTVLEAFGLPFVPGLGGQSLFGGVEPRRESVFAYGFETGVTLDSNGKKLIEHPAVSFLRDADEPSVPEFFDLATDPRELQDACSDQQEECSRLRASLEEWRAEQARQITEGGLSEADLKALRDLGYIGGDEDDVPPSDASAPR